MKRTIKYQCNGCILPCKLGVVTTKEQDIAKPYVCPMARNRGCDWELVKTVEEPKEEIRRGYAEFKKQWMQEHYGVDSLFELYMLPERTDQQDKLERTYKKSRLEEEQEAEEW